MKDPFKITNEKIGIQIGRTVISLAMRPNNLDIFRIPNLENNSTMTNSNKTNGKIVKANSFDNLEKKSNTSIKVKEKGKEEIVCKIPGFYSINFINIKK